MKLNSLLLIIIKYKFLNKYAPFNFKKNIFIKQEFYFYN